MQKGVSTVRGYRGLRAQGTATRRSLFAHSIKPQFRKKGVLSELTPCLRNECVRQHAGHRSNILHHTLSDMSAVFRTKATRRVEYRL